MASARLLFWCAGLVGIGAVACVGDAPAINNIADSGQPSDAGGDSNNPNDTGPGTDSGDAGPQCSTNGAFAWAYPSKPDVGTQYVSTATTTTDSSGNTLATAWYGGAPDFGKGALPASGNTWDSAVVKLDAKGVVQWSAGINGSGTDFSFGIASDPTGAVYVVGSTNSASLNIAGMANALTTVNNQFNGFLVKLSPTGSFVWGKVFQAVGGSGCRGIAANSTSIVLGCDFGGASAFIPGSSLKVTNAESGGPTDQAVIVLDTNGTVQWMRRLGGVGQDSIGGVAIDASGTVLVGGTIASTSPAFVDTNSAATTLPRVGTSPNASFVWIDPSGTLSRPQVFGNPNTSVNQSASTSDVAFDSAGNGYFVGTFRGSMDLKGNTLSSATGQKTCASGAMPPCTDAFVAKIDKTNGAVLFSKSIGGANDDSASNVRVDGCNLVVTGLNRSTNLSIDGLPVDSPVSDITNEGPWAMFGASFDSSTGKAQWAKGLVSADPSAAISPSGLGFTSTGGIRVGLGVQGDVKLDGTNVFSAGQSGQRFIVWALQR